MRYHEGLIARAKAAATLLYRKRSRRRHLEDKPPRQKVLPAISYAGFAVQGLYLTWRTETRLGLG